MTAYIATGAFVSVLKNVVEIHFILEDDDFVVLNLGDKFNVI